MTVTAPPRPSEPLDRQEPEALLEALIEEARQRQRRRRRIYMAVTAVVALVAVVVFAVFDRTAQSQTASPALSARANLPAARTSTKLAYIAGPVGCMQCPGTLYVGNPDGGRQVVARRVWQEVAWSPDGRKIVFLRDGIYVVNANGSGERRLTRGLDFSATWSPDGRTIAFTRSRDGYRHSEVYVINADGTAVRRLTNGTQDSNPAWLPDGRIAFTRIVSMRFPGTFELYVMNADGSGERNLTREWALDGRVDRMGPWSPDGQRIAFTSRRDGNAELYIMDADGSGQRRLTRSAANEGWIAWAPDGRKIAVVSDRDENSDGADPEISVISPDGGVLQRLTRRGSSPLWSPDGSKIAFRSSRDGTTELYVMNAVGSKQRRITRTATEGARVKFQFAWSPAGR